MYTLRFCSALLIMLTLHATQAKGSVLQQLDPQLSSIVARLYAKRPQPYNDAIQSGNPSPVLPKDEQLFVRDNINNTLQFPWRNIGFLLVKFAENDFITCSATLLSPTIIITAAHCFVRPDGHQMQQALFTLARNKKLQPYATVSIKRFDVLPEARKTGLDNNFDLAFAELASPPNKLPLTGVTLASVSDANFASSKGAPMVLVAAGYPTREQTAADAGTLIASASITYRNSIMEGKTNQFEHKGFVAPGVSGGPIFAYDPLYNQFAMVGVVSSQRTWSTGEEWAVGIKLNPFAISKVQEVMRNAGR